MDNRTIPEEYVDIFRKNIFKRVGVKAESFVKPERTCKELYEEEDIQTGPEFESLTSSKNDHLINIEGGDEEKIILKSFNECFFHQALQKNMIDLDIKFPTYIQKAVIPIILHKKNYDLMARAQTGSGKTAAFLLPIIQTLIEIKPNKSGPAPLAIIISPTRELTSQLGATVQKYARGTGLVVATTYGETNILEAYRILKTGVDILVSTPGRLCQFIKEKRVKLNILQFFVLDEADKLLKDQFVIDINYFRDALDKQNSHCRMLMFSATFEEYIRQIATRILSPNYFRISVGVENNVAETVSQEFFQVSGVVKKMELLYELLRHSSTGIFKDDNGIKWVKILKTMVFCNTRRRTNWVAIALNQMGIKSICTNGDRSQKQRQDALELFEKGDCDVLVSTNVTARGLNIVGVDQIVNFDLPTEHHDYVHRVGRTGRIGNTGTAIAFIDPKNQEDVKQCPLMVKYLQTSNQPIPRFMIELL